MNGFQILLTGLFILAGVFQTLGANRLLKIVHELYPDNSQYGFRPSIRILKRIENEKKDDKEIMKRLRKARALELIALFTFIAFLIVFFVGLK